MLIGEYQSKLSDKNRVAVPKVFRENLVNNLILTRGYENCLILVDQLRWDLLINSLEVKPLLSASVRDLKRFLVGGAFQVELDNQGRFVLSAAHINYASITHEVTFVGIGNWIEVWDSKSWLEKINKLSKSITDIAERLSDISNK